MVRKTARLPIALCAYVHCRDQGAVQWPRRCACGSSESVAANALVTLPWEHYFPRGTAVRGRGENPLEWAFAWRAPQCRRCSKARPVEVTIPRLFVRLMAAVWSTFLLTGLAVRVTHSALVGILLAPAWLGLIPWAIGRHPPGSRGPMIRHAVEVARAGKSSDRCLANHLQFKFASRDYGLEFAALNAGIVCAVSETGDAD